MGIHNLNKFLRNNSPNVYQTIHLSEYAFKKIAIDISLYLCKFKASYGQRWLSAFINLISCLRKNEIHCVFIYDSGAPLEKAAEREERAAAREKIEKKVIELETDLDNYFKTGIITDSLIELYKKNKSTPVRLLQNNNNEVDIDIIQKKIEKLRSYVLDISSEDFEITKKLFTVLGVPWYHAPLEAETMCSDLCKRGLVDAVLSEDTDVLAYGAPIFLSKIDMTNETCVRINYNNMLNSLQISADSFLDFCIMCGTDYNKNIYKVGPEKSFKYIQKHRTIEEIAEKEHIDVSSLNHIRGRELFKEYTRSDIVKIPYCIRPDFSVLTQFLFDNNIYIDLENIKKSFINDIIVFEEDD